MLAYLWHSSYTNPPSSDDHGHTEDEVFERSINTIEFSCKNLPLSLLFPCGATNRLAKQNGIPQNVLTSDKYHNLNGLPNVLQSYSILMQLMKYLGVPDKTINKLYYESNPSDTLKNYYKIAQ
mgnify:CR=1 FL=1